MGGGLSATSLCVYQNEITTMDKFCKNHPQKEAISFCHNCGNYYCKDCLNEGKEFYYCNNEECYKKYVEEAEPEVAVAGNLSIINCPNCKKEISNNVKFCPHCGYQLNSESQLKEIKRKKSAIFQIIALAAFVISLFTPMLFLNFFVLIVIGSSIISLVRKEKMWGLSLIALILGLFLLLTPTINESIETSYKEKVSVVNWNWEKEDNYSYVRGRIRNDGDKIISYFKVTAYYLDDYGNVLDNDIDNDLEDLYPGMSKEFEIMHKNSSDYKSVSIEITEVKIK